MAMFDGRKLRELRIAAGLTREDLAYKSKFGGDKVSVSTIEKMENGVVTTPLESKLKLLALALNVSINDFMNEDEASVDVWLTEQGRAYNKKSP